MARVDTGGEEGTERRSSVGGESGREACAAKRNSEGAGRGLRTEPVGVVAPPSGQTPDFRRRYPHCLCAPLRGPRPPTFWRRSRRAYRRFGLWPSRRRARFPSRCPGSPPPRNRRRRHTPRPARCRRRMHHGQRRVLSRQPKTIQHPHRPRLHQDRRLHRPARERPTKGGRVRGLGGPYRPIPPISVKCGW